MLLHFDLDGRFKIFLEVANFSKLIGGPNSAEFYHDRLEILKMRGVIASSFQLVLGIPSKLTPDAINKSLEVLKVFSEEIFEVGLHDQSDVLVAALLLSLCEADNATEV